MTGQNNFRYQPFVAHSGNPDVKVPVLDDVLSSPNKKFIPLHLLNTALCLNFKKIATYTWFCDNIVALKIKPIKRRGSDTHKTTEKRKEHKEDTVFTETGDDDVEFIEEGEGVPDITHVKIILHSIFSNAELYTNNHHIYKSNGFYAHKSPISNNFRSKLTDYKGVLHCEVYDYEEDPENVLEVPFSLEEMKSYRRPDGFMLYGKLGIYFLTTSELLYWKMKVRIKLMRARPNFYMIGENPNVSLGFVDCSLYTRGVMLKGDYHKKKTPQPA